MKKVYRIKKQDKTFAVVTIVDTNQGFMLFTELKPIASFKYVGDVTVSPARKMALTVMMTRLSEIETIILNRDEAERKKTTVKGSHKKVAALIQEIIEADFNVGLENHERFDFSEVLDVNDI